MSAYEYQTHDYDVVVVGAGGAVERAEGDAFHLERLTRDVTRALGTLLPALEGGPR